MFAFNCCYKVVHQVAENVSKDISMNYSPVLIEDTQCAYIIPSFSQMIHQAESMIPSSLMDNQLIHQAESMIPSSLMDNQLIHQAESMIPSSLMDNQLIHQAESMIPSSLMDNQLIHSPVVDISNDEILNKIDIFLTKVEEEPINK
jgi:hypothetical protein